MAENLGKITLGSKDYFFSLSRFGKKSHKILESSTTVFGGSIFDKTTGLFTKQSKTQKFVLEKISKGLNLIKTPGFGKFAIGMGVVAAGVGLIGYLLGKKAAKKEDIPSEENKAEPVVQNQEPEVVELPKAEVVTEEENDYHTIKTGGLTWAEIVTSYYPGLVEKCNGKLYGSDGAIRKLKIALSECSEKDLVKETDIPKILNLPLEIDGISINKESAPKRAKIANGGGHTDVEEAGCKNTKPKFTVIDNVNNQQYTGEELNAAVDSLRSRTGVDEYQLDYVS